VTTGAAENLAQSVKRLAYPIILVFARFPQAEGASQPGARKTRMKRFFYAAASTLAFTINLLAQTESEAPKASIAFEADALAYALPGYSGIVNLSLRNGFQVAFGSGRYEVPGFLLEGDANYDTAKWKATSTSVQVLRAGYRFRGPMKDGFAIGGILLNQNWRLRAERITGETTFRPLSVGVTTGYYFHVGKHFYLYPTFAYTYNTVVSGSTSLQGVNYKVAKFGPNGSLHIGWEWGL
jgi:hypothetical protein